jgi:2-oxoglutarate dehydrogenase E2 component (dihydrolipoamide succinyltransferase)
MIIEIKVPSVGESVTEAILAQWFKQDGDVIHKGEPLFVIETDKITLEVEAEEDGVLSIKVAEGETLAIGAVVGTIDTENAPQKVEASTAPPVEKPAVQPKPEAAIPSVPATAEPIPAISVKISQSAPGEAVETLEPVVKEPTELPGEKILPPSVRRLIAEKGANVSQISGTGPGGRVTKGDVLLYLEGAAGVTEKQPVVAAARETVAPQTIESFEEKTERKAMSPIRQRIAARLLDAKQNTAMLTTFNEIDMSRVLALRVQFKENFKKKYGVSLGFMSFFIKASVEALKEFPEINAFIEDKEIVYHHYQHIGVAVGTERGLVVPVIRHAEKLSLADIEGGTFTISNGGIYGSLLSTPILNMPQSAILGMHKIEKRPVAIDDQVVIRPMMYVALSYDHRIVDGREAVTFLKRIKEFIENPEQMMMEI